MLVKHGLYSSRETEIQPKTNDGEIIFPDE